MPSNRNQKLEFIVVPPDSSRVKAVIKLAADNRKTLGFLPDSAFYDYSRRAGMIVLEDSHGLLIGYALIYISGETSRLHHFCIKSNCRGSRYAHRLMDFLKEHTERYRGIELWCRDDFPAQSMWPKLGFVPLNEKQGRNFQGLTLTYWWFDHNHDSIFTIIEKKRSEGKSVAVLDANVFFGLDDENAPDEDKAIRADWLSEYIEFAVTKEIYNEIYRCNDQKKKRSHRSRAQLLTEIHSDERVFKDAREQLQPLFRSDLTESDHSDIRHLAYIISSKTSKPDFFITRDEGDLLSKSEVIQSSYGFQVVRPSDLVLLFDQKQRSLEYTPKKYAGSPLFFERVAANSNPILVQTFLCCERGEKKSVFSRKVNNALSKPGKVESRIIKSGSSLLGLIIWDKQSPDSLNVPIIRAGSPVKDNTLFQHLIYRSVLEGIQSNHLFVVISDSFLPDYSSGILQDHGFVRIGDQWVKSCITGIFTTSSLMKKIRQIKRRGIISDTPAFVVYLDRVLELLGKMNGHNKAGLLEKQLWPTKIHGENINTFIVPIKPKWAKELFDEDLAQNDLFGSSQHLILNYENVYYRARKPNHFQKLNGKARILWYESQDRANKISEIRAVSYLENVEIGTPKQLFKSYERLGVYTWRDVFAIAKGDLDERVMAIRFSNTENFNNPIGLNDLRTLFQRYFGKQNAIQSPLAIPEEMFAEIYQTGMDVPTDIPVRPRLRLLMSIHPHHVEKIFSGEKAYELRKKRPDIITGDWILVYSTNPVMAIAGAVRVEGILEGSAEEIWSECGSMTRISQKLFNEYFNGNGKAYAIKIDKRILFTNPISLNKLRKLNNRFHPPQGFQYIDAEAGFWWNLVRDQWKG